MDACVLTVSMVGIAKAITHLSATISSEPDGRQQSHTRFGSLLAVFDIALGLRAVRCQWVEGRPAALRYAEEFERRPCSGLIESPLQQIV